jgi:hypothetical protein
MLSQAQKGKFMFITLLKSQVKSSQVKSSQVKSSQVKSSQVKSILIPQFLKSVSLTWEKEVAGITLCPGLLNGLQMKFVYVIVVIL